MRVEAVVESVVLLYGGGDGSLLYLVLGKRLSEEKYWLLFICRVGCLCFYYSGDSIFRKTAQMKRC